jgi:hypothetical protein
MGQAGERLLACWPYMSRIFEDRGQIGNSLQANNDRQRTYPRDRASAANDIFDKALDLPQGGVI